MSLRVWAYSGCDTCRKALKYLQEQKVAHEVIAIREQPPNVGDLRRMLGYLDGDLRRLFNTSGQDYRALKMSEKLPTLSVDDALALLAKNGNLVKRPFVLAPHGGVVGFKLPDWEQLLAD